MSGHVWCCRGMPCLSRVGVTKRTKDLHCNHPEYIIHKWGKNWWKWDCFKMPASHFSTHAEPSYNNVIPFMQQLYSRCCVSCHADSRILFWIFMQNKISPQNTQYHNLSINCCCDKNKNYYLPVHLPLVSFRAECKQCWFVSLWCRV